MNLKGIDIEYIPILEAPLLIAGFKGWGNALNVSEAMTAYLIRTLKAEPFARIKPDRFYRYDEHRPSIDVKSGVLKQLTPPGGAFYAPSIDLAGRTPIILAADEPDLGWHRFAEDIFALCQTLGIDTVITMGSMFDNVLHTDRTLSAIASSEDLLERLRQRNVYPITYQGPSAVHGAIHAEAVASGLTSLSIWCHCPYYLQGITHFGLLASLGALLSGMWHVELDTAELEINWEKMNARIQEMVDQNPEIQDLIRKLRKEKVKGSFADMKSSAKHGEKVIHLQDFLEPR
jgi:predicted ATP-grasp superfamily ATP-dependent carboligase